jgi:hypothetical protein
MTPCHNYETTMPKRRICIEIEADLHEAIGQEAARQGTSKAEIVRKCAQNFLSKVYDTSGPNPKKKSKT